MISSSGTTPPGTANEQQAAEWVRDMFGDVAPKYDFLNHLLSFNIDRNWRRALRSALQPSLQRADAAILDLCCGTGDVLLYLQEQSRSKVYGADFCHPMLVSAQRKCPRNPLFEADGLEMPVADASFDAISIAFGFRNFANYPKALSELLRILKPGGTLAILEFSHPHGLLLRAAYGFYLNLVLPLTGGLVSGNRSAYRYLADSICKFPDADRLRDMMTAAGFKNTTFQLLSGGISALHLGTKL